MAQTWGGLSSNQCPDWDALKDAIDTGVLPSGGTAITGTTQSVYKTIGGATPLTSYVNIDTSNAGYTSRSSNQSLWKSDLTTAGTSGNTFTMYGTSSQGCINIYSQVKTDTGETKNACDLQVGDKVFTKENPTDAFDYYTISDVTYSEKESVELTTKNFTIEVSMTQPLFRDDAWVDVKDLNVGDKIYTEYGYEEIVSIKNLGVQQVVIYNIQGAHTFFANGIFCHNKTLYPLIGWGSASTACANWVTATAFSFFYSGTFGNGTIIYSNTNQGGFPSAYLWGTGTGNYYYNSTTGFAFTVTYNSVAQTYTVANYTACATTTTTTTTAAPTSTVSVYIKRSLGTGGFLWWSSNGGTSWTNASIGTINTGCNSAATNITVPASTTITWVLSQNSTANDPNVNGWYPTTGASGTGTCPAQSTVCGTSYSATSPASGGSTTISITCYTNVAPC